MASNMNNLQNTFKYLCAIATMFGLFLSGISIAFAVPITVPSAPGNGYALVSTTTGAWQATTTQPFHVGTIYATSTTGTSTFNNGIAVNGGCISLNGTCFSSGGSVTNVATTYPVLGGPITTTGTISLAFGTTTANSWSGLQTLNAGFNSTASSTGTWTNFASSTITVLALPSSPSAILLTNANGVVSVYAGTSCTNQFPRSLSALGAATCASVATTDFASANISQWTNNSGYVTFPFTVNATNNSTSTLLGLNGGIISVASSTHGNLSMQFSTSTQSTSTNMYSNFIQGLVGRFTSITATSGITFADGYTQTRGSFNFGTTDTNATTTDIFTMQSFDHAVTIQSIYGVIDCPNGCASVPSGITVKFWHGTNRSASTTATALFTVNPTFTSTTTLQTFNTGFNDNTLTANEILWYQIVSASTTQMSIDFTGTGTND